VSRFFLVFCHVVVNGWNQIYFVFPTSLNKYWVLCLIMTVLYTVLHCTDRVLPMHRQQIQILKEKTRNTGESVPVELTTRGPRGKFIVGAPEITTPRTFSIEMDLSGKLMKQQCWEAQRTKNLKSGCTKLIDLVEDYRITHMFLYSCSQGLHQPCTNNRRSADELFEQCQLHIFSGDSPNK